MRYGNHWSVRFVLLLLLVLCFVSTSQAVSDQEQKIQRNLEILKTPRLLHAYKKAAIDRLIAIGQPAVPALILALGDDDPSMRAAAVYALGEIGPAAQQAIPALIEALKNPRIGRAAGLALGRIGPAAIPALSRVLVESENPGIKSVAASALG